MKLSFIFQIMLSVVCAALGCDVAIAPAPDALGGTEGKGIHIGGENQHGKTDTLEREYGNGNAERDDYKPNALEQGVTMLRRGNYIIDTFTRMGKVENVNSMIVEYYTMDQKERTIVAQGGLTQGTRQTNGFMTYTFEVDNPNLLDKYSQLVVAGTSGYYDDGTVKSSVTGVNELTLQVVGVNYETSIVTVVPVNGKHVTSNYDIDGYATLFDADGGTILFNIGLAVPETAIKSAPVSAIPLSYTNYMQKFMSTTLQSRVSQETVNRANWTPADDDEYAVEEFKKDIEFSYIWGKKSRRKDTNAGCNVWTTSGIIEQWIEKGGTPLTIDFDNATEATINEMIEQIFVGNNGADKRLLLCGPGFATKISNIAGIDKQISGSETEVVFGRTWKKWQGVHGELDMTILPAFSERGIKEDLWKNAALVIDPQFITKKVLRSIERLSLNLREAGDSDADSNVLMEISCLVLKNAKAHALIIPQGD